MLASISYLTSIIFLITRELQIINAWYIVMQDTVCEVHTLLEDSAGMHTHTVNFVCLEAIPISHVVGCNTGC